MIQHSFSKHDFELLLRMLDGMDWIMDAHKVKEDPRIQPYRNMISRICERAAEVGFETAVEIDEKSGKYLFTQDFSEANPVMEFVEEFEEDTFWSELPDRLGERDFRAEVPEEERREMSQLEHFNAVYRFIDRYEEEIAHHGLGRIVIPGVTSEASQEAAANHQPFGDDEDEEDGEHCHDENCSCEDHEGEDQDDEPRA